MDRVQPTSIRLNAELLEKIKKTAKEEKRSVSAQIEYMLLQYYEMKNLMMR